MLTQRISKLRKQSLDAVNKICPERAILVTDFYEKEAVKYSSVPIQRAQCFAYILKHKKILINEREWIVGERGSEPKATPTYPEITLHSLEDLDVLDRREKVFFKVDEATRRVYEERIIPFWKGKTNRDRIMEAMTPEWLEAYAAGMFTEFQEQRAPGHTVAGGKMYRKGMIDFIDEIHKSKREHTDQRRLDQLEAMEIAANAIIEFAGRYASELTELAKAEENSVRKTELERMADICRRVPAYAPGTLHEALQYYWFIHIGVITELNPWDSYNPGRLDQHLLPFYRRDLANGLLTEADAKELLQSFWIKFNNQPAPPKIGVTALESNTYTDFCLINLGGLTEEGSDAVNEMTYLLLDVIEEMRLLQPSSMIQVSAKNPDDFILRALKIIKTGFGQPSVFNTDAIIQEMLRQGKSLEDARRGGASGCVETGAFGVESYTLTGYFNLAKLIELTLHEGLDPKTGKQIGPQSGDPLAFQNFEEFMLAYRKQLLHMARIKIEGNTRIEKINAQYMPVPFMSLFTDDCIANAKDYNEGGARYNSSYIQGVGTGSTTDSLAALKFHVFDHQTITMDHFIKILGKDFEGAEDFRFRLLNETPKYGNDEDYADDILKELFEYFFEAIDGQPTFKGGHFRINLLPTTSHVYFGSVIGALPDGRKAGKPLSEGISPVQGADRKGPTAVLKSASKIDHIRTGGTLLNQKFLPSFFDHERNYPKLVALIRSYFKMNGHHIQFNVVDAQTLREAQRHPEEYRDLIVRVAGYSDYFNDLGEDLQNEIIARTEHF
jgi:pyruvate formate-lyase/glycerol dehydratase family glycyl radical enzyme